MSGRKCRLFREINKLLASSGSTPRNVTKESETMIFSKSFVQILRKDKKFQFIKKIFKLLLNVATQTQYFSSATELVTIKNFA